MTQIDPTSIETSNAGLPPKKTSQTALWSFLFGAGSIFGCFFIGPIIAFILGGIALKQFKKSPESLSGRWLAVTGIILGGIGTLISLLFGFGFVRAILSNPDILQPVN